ncbi:MAG: restriction endonuclease subunit S, partial [Muribaculum sp.]|nr:restriction endonuclease subunit S [Muribaculum sp.]
MKKTKHRLGDICQIINGRAYKQEELQSQGKYRILRVGNFFSRDKWYYSDMELADDKYCNKGDLLFAWSASFGPKLWNSEKTIYHYHIWKMVPDKCVDKLYLYYWLKNSVSLLTAGTHGSVMAHMTKREMESQEIEIPDIDIQKRIGSILSLIDRKMESNEKINDNL